MGVISFQEVDDIRQRFAQARELTNERFREAFAATSAQVPPNERWRSHLELQAAALLEHMQGVRLAPGYRIAYIIRDEPRLLIPVVVTQSAPTPIESDPDRLSAANALFPFFSLDQTPAALFEYWILTSELLSSPSWSMTRLIANAGEYDEALNRMQQPQLVQALFVSYPPEGDFLDDGTGRLQVTVYTRADEERIERRRLLLDRNHEFHFHGRDLIAEGRGGIPV